MNPLTDPTRRPPGYAAIYCHYCGEFLAWCNPPAPPVPTRCATCRQPTNAPTKRTTPMHDLDITIDEQMPPHAVFVSLDLSGQELRVRVSPRVTADVLVSLRSDIADLIAAEIDNLPAAAATDPEGTP